MSTEEYKKISKKLLAYFEQHFDEDGAAWRYGYDQATQWALLLDKGTPDREQIEDLMSAVNNPSEGQGSAFCELAIFVNRWGKELLSEK